MEATHGKARRWLENWKLQNEEISEIVHATTGNRHENIWYVGEGYVLKCTADLSKMQTNLALASAMADAGLCAATPIKTKDGQEYLQEDEMFFA